MNQLKLSETTFEQCVDWCERNIKWWEATQYVTVPRLRIIYDYCVKHGLICKGRKCSVSWKGGEWISSFSQPLEYEPTREDFEWNLFHEVWCKTEWAVRCGRHETELGYESVKSEFGMPIIKELREV